MPRYSLRTVLIFLAVAGAGRRAAVRSPIQGCGFSFGSVTQGGVRCAHWPWALLGCRFAASRMLSIRKTPVRGCPETKFWEGEAPGKRWFFQQFMARREPRPPYSDSLSAFENTSKQLVIRTVRRHKPNQIGLFQKRPISAGKSATAGASAR